MAVRALGNSLRSRARATLAPIVRLARSALTPPVPAAEFVFHAIAAGPAANCQILAPENSELGQLFTAGQYESDCLRLVAEWIEDGNCCWDIGAHYGYYTLAMARLTATGAVHTFEPMPHNAGRVRDSVKKSNLHNVTVHQLAVADRSARMTLKTAASPDGDDSMGYLDAFGGVDTPRSRHQYPTFAAIEVSTATLDAIHAPAPQFIKIDAEGAEFAILSGGRELLSTARPRLLVEVHSIKQALQCAQLLDRLGYSAHLPASSDFATPIAWLHQSDAMGLAKLRTAWPDSIPIAFAPSSGQP